MIDPKKGPNPSSEGRTTYVRDGRAPIPDNEAVSRVMSANKAKNTKPEVVLRKYLWHHNVKGYRSNWKKAPGQPDICFPGKKVALFVHGCFWHRCPICKPPLPKTNTEFWQSKFERNQERDARKISELEKAGWKVLVIWECQIRQDLNECALKVRQMVQINND